MAELSRRLLAFLLLSVSATQLLSLVSSQEIAESRSSSSRREAEEQTYVGRPHRGNAMTFLCKSVAQGFVDLFTEDDTGVWKTEYVSTIGGDIQKKPILSK